MHAASWINQSPPTKGRRNCCAHSLRSNRRSSALEVPVGMVLINSGWGSEKSIGGANVAHDHVSPPALETRSL